MVNVEPPSPSPNPEQKGFLQKNKYPLLAVFVTIAVMSVLISPIIPVHSEYTITKTRTRNFAYNPYVYGILPGLPMYVNVTNNDSTGGNFSVTMNKFRGTFANLNIEYSLDATVTQSLYIAAGATGKYNLPTNWSWSPLDKFTYSVSPPSTKEDYNVTETKTEHKSILNLIERAVWK